MNDSIHEHYYSLATTIAHAPDLAVTVVMTCRCGDVLSKTVNAETNQANIVGPGRALIIDANSAGPLAGLAPTLRAVGEGRFVGLFSARIGTPDGPTAISHVVAPKHQSLIVELSQALGKALSRYERVTVDLSYWKEDEGGIRGGYGVIGPWYSYLAFRPTPAPLSLELPSPEASGMEMNRIWMPVEGTPTTTLAAQGRAMLVEADDAIAKNKAKPEDAYKEASHPPCRRTAGCVLGTAHFGECNRVGIPDVLEA